MPPGARAGARRLELLLPAALAARCTVTHPRPATERQCGQQGQREFGSRVNGAHAWLVAKKGARAANPGDGSMTRLDCARHQRLMRQALSLRSTTPPSARPSASPSSAPLMRNVLADLAWRAKPRWHSACAWRVPSTSQATTEALMARLLTPVASTGCASVAATSHKRPWKPGGNGYWKSRAKA